MTLSNTLLSLQKSQFNMSKRGEICSWQSFERFTLRYFKCSCCHEYLLMAFKSSILYMYSSFSQNCLWIVSMSILFAQILVWSVLILCRFNISTINSPWSLKMMSPHQPLATTNVFLFMHLYHIILHEGCNNLHFF